MWRDKSISVVFPTYNEKDSIRAAILDYFATGLVDEIIVVNNNAAAGTSERWPARGPGRSSSVSRATGTP